jgi:hypothetical protein
VSLSLDTSVFVCLFRPEPLSGVVERWLKRSNDEIVVSDFGCGFTLVTLDARWLTQHGCSERRSRFRDEAKGHSGRELAGRGARLIA